MARLRIRPYSDAMPKPVPPLFRPLLLSALLLCLSPWQVAADPLDAQAPVPKADTPRALQGYRRLAEPAPLPWRQANDTVHQIGGWRSYAREAAAPASVPAPTPAASGHQGHRP